MKTGGTKHHPLHRKESVAYAFNRRRSLWRVYWRLNKLILELGLEHTSGGK